MGIKGAKDLIGMIKIVAPNMVLDVIDRAIQIYGGAGTFLLHAFAAQRCLRLADGPDEVHMMQLGGALGKAQAAVDAST